MSKYSFILAQFGKEYHDTFIYLSSHIVTDIILMKQIELEAANEEYIRPSPGRWVEDPRCGKGTRHSKV